jgi:hypothetical protein
MNEFTLSATEQKFLRQLKRHLGEVGILFPVTTNQVAAFEQKIEKEKTELFLFPDLELILSQGYKLPKKMQITPENEPKDTEDFWKAAARNGKEIPESVLRKMREDRGE